MNKYLNWLKERTLSDYARFLVVVTVAKAIVFDISYATFLITIPVLAFEAYQIYLKAKAPDPVKINEEVKRELDAIKTRLNASSLQKDLTPAQTKRYF